MSDMSLHQQHRMQCASVEAHNNDLVFEFVCPECGYSVVLPLIERLLQGQMTISHANIEDEEQPLMITFQKNVSGDDVPPAFRDFLSKLD